MVKMLSLKSIYINPHKQAINACTGYPALRHKFGINYTLSPQDELYLDLIKLLKHESLLDGSDNELRELIKGIPMSKQAMKLVERIANAKYLNLVNWYGLNDVFQGGQGNLVQSHAFKILLAALTPYKEKP